MSAPRLVDAGTGACGHPAQGFVGERDMLPCATCAALRGSMRLYVPTMEGASTEGFGVLVLHARPFGTLWTWSNEPGTGVA